MIPPIRRQKLVALLSARNFCTLAELADELDISVSTVRRYLNELEFEGIAKRTHGGVMHVAESVALPEFGNRKDTMAREKNAIGRRAAELVQDGETIIIDGGTTPFQIALHLQNKNIQVVTNSLPVVNLFANSRNVQVVHTGGILFPGTGVFLGPYAADMLKTIHAQKAFIGVSGITAKGLYNSNALVVDTEKSMFEAASEVYVVTDHTKFERSSLAFLCDLTKITGLITDTLPPQNSPLHNMLTEAGVTMTEVM